MFTQDVDSCHRQILDAVKGKRVLVIGGAGSIGSAAVFQLLRFSPRALHVTDHNENNLAELVRDLRNQQDRVDIPDFRALPIDFGSPVMDRLVREQPPYEIVMNFAAIKHVRSEKDTYSILQMLDTNVIKPAHLLRWLVQRGGVQRYFCVSTDKAANPVNIMGASKRIMEGILFSEEVAKTDAAMTSARFANVAFSDGSLLHSWLKRLEKGQPLVVPRRVERFFISSREAGQICLLAGTCVLDRTILIPRLQPETDSRKLSDIARAFLRMHGFEPHECHSEEEAKASIDPDRGSGRYPLLLTPLDTNGEKPYEEFVGHGEESQEIGLPNLMAISGSFCTDGSITRFLSSVEQHLRHPDMVLHKENIIELIRTVVPEFHHYETGRNLDDQM